MERLTPKDLHPHEVKNFVDRFNDKGDDPYFRSKVIDKLWEYEESEEQGLIVKLPCKVGDVIYAVDEVRCCDSEKNSPVMAKLIVDKISIDERTVKVSDAEYFGRMVFTEFSFDDFEVDGYIFTTEAEALQALKERE